MARLWAHAQDKPASSQDHECGSMIWMKGTVVSLFLDKQLILLESIRLRRVCRAAKSV
jgi:hypothetical protein